MGAGFFLWHAVKAGIQKIAGDEDGAYESWDDATDSLRKPAFSDAGDVLSDIGDTVSDMLGRIFDKD